jgi:hypothetical protein
MLHARAIGHSLQNLLRTIITVRGIYLIILKYVLSRRVATRCLGGGGTLPL